MLSDSLEPHTGTPKINNNNINDKKNVYKTKSHEMHKIIGVYTHLYDMSYVFIS